MVFKRHIFVISLFCALFFAAGKAQAQDAKIKNFIQSMGDEVTGYIGDPAISLEQKKQNLKGVLNKNFDMNTISRFTLGTYWKDLTEAEQKEYRALYEEMIVSVYADKLSNYDGQSFKVESVKPLEGNDYTVMSYIKPKSGENVSVNWRVRAKNGEYRIIDVAIQEVSQIITQRSDFASTIQRHGGKASSVLDFLRERAAKGKS